MTHPAPIPPSILERWRRLGLAPQAVAARDLPLFTEPAELVEVALVRDRSHYLAPAAADAWRQLQRAAREDGITLSLISGFRSLERQTELIEAKLGQGQALADILTVLAPPGCSEHHSGRAVDIGTPGFRGLDESFETSPAFRWLSANAARFGFGLSFPRDNPWGYCYEPWHWCHHPPGP